MPRHNIKHRPVNIEINKRGQGERGGDKVVRYHSLQLQACLFIRLIPYSAAFSLFYPVKHWVITLSLLYRIGIPLIWPCDGMKGLYQTSAWWIVCRGYCGRSPLSTALLIWSDNIFLSLSLHLRRSSILFNHHDVRLRSRLRHCRPTRHIP